MKGQALRFQWHASGILIRNMLNFLHIQCRLGTFVFHTRIRGQNIYPQLSSKLDSFRLGKKNYWATIACKLAHCSRLMAEKYKKIKAPVGAGLLHGILPSTEFLIGIGTGVSILLATVSAIFGAGDSNLAVLSKMFDSEIEKHRNISTIVPAKQETVNRLAAKWLID